MLKINDKTFLNIQEAVQWLMDNNALPFQCTANYAANTEVGLGTIVNPTMAKVRIGSLIFFADSKVSTVTGVTSNGFIVSDQYNDLVDDVVYVSNVQLNASGHLIVTLSNGTDIDAGLIKQIVNFSIDPSQHLIATYNDGTISDLGAIFSGNINIAGNLTVSETVDGKTITGNEIIEKMSGYSAILHTPAYYTLENVYTSVAKTGNKITFVVALNITKNDAAAADDLALVQLTIPASVGVLLHTANVGGYNFLANDKVTCFNTHYSGIDVFAYFGKVSNNILNVMIDGGASNLVVNTKYYFRYEKTFLLGDDIMV